MADILEVDTADLISRAAAKLKEKGLKKPEYVDYVKTGAGRERPPTDEDFWYTRCASVLRQVYLNGPIGISRLRARYGNRKNHTRHRHHHYKGGGSVIKDAFDELEKAGYVKTSKQGRTITPAGRSFLDKMANDMLKGA